MPCAVANEIAPDHDINARPVLPCSLFLMKHAVRERERIRGRALRHASLSPAGAVGCTMDGDN
jgi:hypothetical protein